MYPLLSNAYNCHFLVNFKAMENLIFKIIEPNNILIILPLIKQLNQDINEGLLQERVLEMSTQNYECVGVYDEEKLIGISGLWFQTRHYSGRSVEPDHVVIAEAYRSKGIGKLLFQWIDQYAREKGYETIELNTYVQNTASHKFYYNEGYKILGFHFLKPLN